jgi:hypothetical protein
MPRKNRCTALALVFALLVCLAGQAAVAAPLVQRAANDSTAGDVLGAVWAWLASQWANFGNVVAGPARPAPTATEKSAGGTDPNSGPHFAGHLVIRGN